MIEHEQKPDEMAMAKNPFKDLSLHFGETAQEFDRTGYLMLKYADKLKTYPLDKKEARRLVVACRSKSPVLQAIRKMVWLYKQSIYAEIHNLPIPKEIEHDLFTLSEMYRKHERNKESLDERIQKDPIGVLQEAKKVSDSDPFRKEVTHLFNKYEQPKRVARNKARIEKISRWEGRETIYSGMEEISESPKSKSKSKG
jgi:hypothetical protein